MSQAVPAEYLDRGCLAGSHRASRQRRAAQKEPDDGHCCSTSAGSGRDGAAKLIPSHCYENGADQNRADMFQRPLTYSDCCEYAIIFLPLQRISRSRMILRRIGPARQPEVIPSVGKRRPVRSCVLLGKRYIRSYSPDKSTECISSPHPYDIIIPDQLGLSVPSHALLRCTPPAAPFPEPPDLWGSDARPVLWLWPV